MASLDSAKTAKKELQGTSMYLFGDVNVMMKIQYSTMEKLEITQDNEKARDYTIQSLRSCIQEKPQVGQNIE